MKKIRKRNKLVGRFGGKRIKTTTKKWMKMMIDNPETPVSFKEDDETDKLADDTELLISIREKLKHGGELTEEEQTHVDRLRDKVD